MKMAALQPRRGRYDFEAADELVRFALRNGKTVRGHTLIWGQSLPLWLVDHGVTDKLGLRLPPIALPPLPDPLGRLLDPVGRLLDDTTIALTGWRRDELLAVMKDHIRRVMRHFAGDVAEWDVVNEPIAADGTLAPTVWRRFIGPDYVAEALRAARTADPERQALHQRLRRRVRRDRSSRACSRSCATSRRAASRSTASACRRTSTSRSRPTRRRSPRRCAPSSGWASRCSSPSWTWAMSLLGIPRAERMLRQAAAYGAAARACNAVAACTRFTTWGFTDAVTWLPAAESGLLFDRSYRAKPALRPRCARRSLPGTALSAATASGPACAAACVAGAGRRRAAASRRAGGRGWGRRRAAAAACASAGRRGAAASGRRAVGSVAAAPAPPRAGPGVAFEHPPHEREAAGDVHDEDQRERQDLRCLVDRHVDQPTRPGGSVCELGAQPHEGEHGLGGVGALVALVAARARERLVHVLDRQQAEAARDPVRSATSWMPRAASSQTWS